MCLLHLTRAKKCLVVGKDARSHEAGDEVPRDVLIQPPVRISSTQLRPRARAHRRDRWVVASVLARARGLHAALVLRKDGGGGAAPERVRSVVLQERGHCPTKRAEVSGQYALTTRSCGHRVALCSLRTSTDRTSRGSISLGPERANAHRRRKAGSGWTPCAGTR